MLAMPTLISAEQEIHLLFAHLPKPSWVPLQRSQQLLLTMPTALPDKAGCGRGSFPAAWEAAPVQSPAQVTSSAGSAMDPWCAGEAEHQMQGASWQVTGLQTRVLVGMWQEDQTCKVQ